MDKEKKKKRRLFVLLITSLHHQQKYNIYFDCIEAPERIATKIETKMVKNERQGQQQINKFTNRIVYTKHTQTHTLTLTQFSKNCKRIQYI